ncbi:RNA 2',3'-cyclic phosphodiesterase [candidate division TA06 bacterium]|nr:RNA 2',3'-cyclic phosphodiesterase [candidate division TA06 bacterium]
MNLIRCFIALELPSPVQEHLAHVITRLKEPQADIKWVEAKNTHLTLKFLGEITSEQLNCAREFLLKQSGKNRAICCHVGQMGVFPSWSRPQVVWLGLKDGIQELSALQIAVENGLADCGFARDPKKFKPHLTLGRVRSPNKMDKLAEKIRTLPLKEMEFSFGKLALIKSTLTQNGPIYQPLETIKLS